MKSETDLALLKEAISILKEDIKIVKREQASLAKNSIELHVNQEQLEKRLVQHSARHESNYKDLRIAFDSLKHDLEAFKGDVLKKLDQMTGRDSVLKFLFGGAVVAIVIGSLQKFIGL